MFRALLMIVVLGFTASAAGQPSSPPPQITEKVGSHDPYPTHSVTFANGVRGIPDITYDTQTGYRPLRLDLYLPKDSIERPATGFPLVIYIHGGAWLTGNSRHATPFADFPGVLASLAAKGYVVASINYRLSNEAPFPAQIQDVKTAIQWLKANADAYGIDSTHVVTWGVSAGGYLAVLASVTCHAAALEPKRSSEFVAPDAVHATATAMPVPDCVQGAVSWYGAFDMSTIAAQATQDGAFRGMIAAAPSGGCSAASALGNAHQHNSPRRARSVT